MVDSIQRITSVLESARDLTFGAAAVASSRIGESSYTQYSKSIDPDALSRLLNSRNSREVKDAMKRVMSLMATNDATVDLKALFADVLKNISSEDLKVKRMVCVYLLRFAESDPNLALLSVNTIQKSLSERDPEAKALALKALSDINVPSLFPITLQSVKKSITDSNPLVRSTSAMTIYKLFQECNVRPDDEVEDTRVTELESLLKQLLADPDPLVVSSCIIVYHNCLPERFDLLHGHFRRFCAMMPSLTHWAQSVIVEIFIQYCRQYVERPILVSTDDNTEIALPVPEEVSLYLGNSYTSKMDPDLELFLDSLKPLLFSSNASVIVGVFKAHFMLAPIYTLKEVGIPQCLIKCLQLSCKENQCMVLQVILFYASHDQSAFIPMYKSFFLTSTDDQSVSTYKLKILAHLITTDNVKSIITELKFYISGSHDSIVVKKALNTMIVCAHISTTLSAHIMKWLLTFMERDELSDSEITSEYVNVIRHLIQINPSKNLSAMIKLSEIVIDTDVLSGYAKAGIIWLIGEYIHVEPRIVPDILRKLLPNFPNESKESRLQILLLAAKLLSFDIDKSNYSYDFENSRINKLFESVLYLAKFDDDFDVRDKARSLSSLVSNKRYEILSLLLQAPKPWPSLSLFSYLDKPKDIALLGLSSEIVNYFKVRDWSTSLSAVDRSPLGVNDFMKTKLSISSNTYFSGRARNQFKASKASSPPSSKSPTPERTNTNTFTSSQGKTYKLQSLDEFFADIPQKTRKKQIVIEEEDSEESSDSCTTSSNDEEDDDPEDSSDSKTVPSDSE